MPRARTKPAAAAVELVGRDEMNLAEFPIALLTHRANTQTLTLHKERMLTLADGRTLKQEWTVSGAPEYGLPQSGDEDVLLGLLKLAADDGFISDTVEFSQRSLLSLICWPSQAWSHQRLEQALARLKTTSILAKNSFWDKQDRGYRKTVHFGLIDSYQLVDRAGWHNNGSTSTNRVRFSKEFFGSIRGGYIKPLSLGLYFALESSVSKRLFRYLDKKRYQKARFEINLVQLASLHVGLSLSEKRYTSWIKQKLKAAHEELIQCGFLEKVEYGLDRDRACKVIYTFAPVRAAIDNNATDLVQALVAKGITERTARSIVAEKTRDLIEHHLDVVSWLVRTDPRSIRNPAAFLTKAIREEWTLQPPGYRGPAGASRQEETERESEHTRQAAQKEAESEALEHLKASLSTGEMDGLRSEALAKVQGELGHMLRIHEKSPFVEVALNQLLRARLEAC